MDSSVHTLVLTPGPENRRRLRRVGNLDAATRLIELRFRKPRDRDRDQWSYPSARAGSGRDPNRRRQRLIRIAISVAAYEAICATLPLGSVGYENASTSGASA